MSRSNGFAVRPALLAGLLAAAAAAMPVMAQEAGGLGAAFPLAQNVSVAPGYAVYRFIRDGVVYIQVNAAGGQVLGAVAAGSGHYLTLPIGRATVSTPEHPLPAINAPSIKVYDDGTTAVSVAASSSQTQLVVTVDQEQTKTSSRSTQLLQAADCPPCGIPALRQQ